MIEKSWADLSSADFTERWYNEVYSKITYSVLTSKIQSWMHGSLEKKIKFNGYTENISYYLKQSHLYINSSLFEGFPNSVVEAINYNLPIISSQSFGGINDILPNENYGSIIENFNENSLSRTIELFYNNNTSLSLRSSPPINK